MTGPRHIDLVAAAGAVVAAVMAAVYVAVIRQQGDRPLPWVLAVLLGAAVAAGYGARTSSAHRRPALLCAGVLLVLLGVLALLSIGLPIIVAGGLCLAAAVRARVDEPLSFPPRPRSPGRGQ